MHGMASHMLREKVIIGPLMHLISICVVLSLIFLFIIYLDLWVIKELLGPCSLVGWKTWTYLFVFNSLNCLLLGFMSKMINLTTSFSALLCDLLFFFKENICFLLLVKVCAEIDWKTKCFFLDHFIHGDFCFCNLWCVLIEEK